MQMVDAYAKTFVPPPDRIDFMITMQSVLLSMLLHASLSTRRSEDIAHRHHGWLVGPLVGFVHASRTR